MLYNQNSRSIDIRYQRSFPIRVQMTFVPPFCEIEYLEEKKLILKVSKYINYCVPLYLYTHAIHARDSLFKRMKKKKKSSYDTVKPSRLFFNLLQLSSADDHRRDH